MYKFYPRGQPVEATFRAIALDQLDEALSDVERPPGEGRSVVHEARRRCKKLRGLLRLVRPAFPDFARENAAIRDASAVLSHLRDAEVLHLTVAGLARINRNDTLKALSDRLADEPASAPRPEKLSEFRDRLREIRARVETWSLTREGLSALLPGLRRTYRDDRRGLTSARRDRASTQFHEWRKANKNHGFHIDLLHRAAPDILGPDLEALEKLSALLGEHQDLSVLALAATQTPERFGDGDTIAVLTPAIAARQSEIEAQAFELGRQLLAERPRALVARLARYWKSAA